MSRESNTVLLSSRHERVTARDMFTQRVVVIYGHGGIGSGKISVKHIALLAAVSQVALVVAAGSAEARDLPRRAPAGFDQPTYSWTGCYAGGHVGAGWNRQQLRESNWSYGPGGSYVTATNTLDSSGGIYGAQVGCNYQFMSNWVVGVQGDWAGAHLRDEVTDPMQSYFRPTTGASHEKTDWLASVTGRLGFTAWDNRALLYVKGGVAWDKNRWDFAPSAYCQFYRCINPAVDDRRTGWTIGAGGEWVISPAWSNLTAFIEYNYYDFGSDGPSFQVGTSLFDPRNAILAEHQIIHTAKIGLNYKLLGAP
jgi:outer membrane immunogenic protein